ncbi:MAG TPA: helix-turn-helix domain-containing protein [Opitutaceae bacterium]|jgi:DNA-binding HxlR family transcriptional regulator
MPKPARSRVAPTVHRSTCPIASSLDVVGDRWSLVVIRDLFRGLKYYREFQSGPEGIPTNILADRLRRLERDGIIQREPYQTNPVRFAYSLTRKGADLKPVLGALGYWAMNHLPEVKPNPSLMAMLRK